MNFTHILETCIYTAQLDRAEEFYKDKLGLQLISKVIDEHVFFRCGNSVLLVFNPEHSRFKSSPPSHAGYGPVHFAFAVKAEEYDSAKEEIKRKGILITDEITWKNGTLSFYFNDPDGHVLEIAMERLWE